MERQQVLLAKSLDACGIPLSVASFDERLILQKAVYLIQSAGIRMGYRFRWYLRGPYSPDMTADAFCIVNAGDAAKEELKRWTLDPVSTQSAQKLQPLLHRNGESVGDKVKRLELLASALFLYNTQQADPADHEKTARILKSNKKNFSAAQVAAAAEELRRHGLVAQNP